MRALLLLLVACGSIKVAPEPILPPNVDQACARAIECGAVNDDQPACVACLDVVAEQWEARLRELYGDVLTLETVTCAQLTEVSVDRNLTACTAARWYGP